MRDIYHPAKFYSDRIRGFASAHVRLRAPLFTRLFFWFYPSPYTAKTSPLTSTQIRGKNLPPTHRSRDTAHAQWLQTRCQWYSMGDVRTHNSRTDSHRIFKLGGGTDHVTRHVCSLVKVKRSKVKVIRSRNVPAAIML